MTESRRAAGEWTLWVVAISSALHAWEEYATGWQAWAVDSLGLAMPTGRFALMNVVLVAAGLAFAAVGWRRTAAALVIPAATLVNALFLHLLPTVLEGRIVPGFWTALLLYLPFSTWAFVAAWRDGVPRRNLAFAFLGGSAMMTTVILVSRALGPVARSAALGALLLFPVYSAFQ